MSHESTEFTLSIGRFTLSAKLLDDEDKEREAAVIADTLGQMLSSIWKCANPDVVGEFEIIFRQPEDMRRPLVSFPDEAPTYHAVLFEGESLCGAEVDGRSHSLAYAGDLKHVTCKACQYLAPHGATIKAALKNWKGGKLLRRMEMLDRMQVVLCKAGAGEDYVEIVDDPGEAVEAATRLYFRLDTPRAAEIDIVRSKYNAALREAVHGDGIVTIGCNPWPIEIGRVRNFVQREEKRRALVGMSQATEPIAKNVGIAPETVSRLDHPDGFGGSDF